MSRDLVAEKKHKKELCRKKVRLLELVKGDGSGKYKHGSMGNDPLPPRKVAARRGPKKFKWRRDVLKKGQA